MRIFIGIVMSVVVCAQGLESPRLGRMLDAGGSVRDVYGVAASVTVGAPVAAGVVSFASSSKLWLAKTDTSVVWSDGSVDAPPGPALFAIDKDMALVYFPQTRQFARWHDGQLDPLDWLVDGEVLSLRASGEIAVRRSDGVAIVRRELPVVDRVAATGPILLLAEAVMFAVDDGVVLRRPDGSEIRFDIAGVRTFAALSENYVHVRTATASYAIRVEPGRESVCQLPEPQQ